MDLFEALYTTRAMRRVKSDPIPEDDVKLLLDAAVRAPSGSNMQNWRWLTVTDRETVAAMGVLYREAWRHLNETVYAGSEERARVAKARGDDTMLRVIGSAQWLADNWEQVPLVILPFHRNDPSGASIYPAIWNLMLAARGLGIGTTLTTVMGFFRGDQLAQLLGVPTERGWTNAAAITCGYPLGRWGLARRTPVHEVAYSERWGEPVTWTVEEPVGWNESS